MLATPHLLAGAAIGNTLRRPWLAWPAAFVSHFLLDLTPHLDSHRLFGVPQGGPTVPEAAMGVADFVFGVMLVGWLTSLRPGRRVVLGGAFFGVLMDLADNVPPWGMWFRGWGPTGWLSHLHHGFQHNVSPEHWPLGLGTQIAVVALALWVCLRWQPPSGEEDSRSPLSGTERGWG